MVCCSTSLYALPTQPKRDLFLLPGKIQTLYLLLVGRMCKPLHCGAIPKQKCDINNSFIVKMPRKPVEILIGFRGTE